MQQLTARGQWQQGSRAGSCSPAQQTVAHGGLGAANPCFRAARYDCCSALGFTTTCCCAALFTSCALPP